MNTAAFSKDSYKNRKRGHGQSLSAGLSALLALSALVGCDTQQPSFKEISSESQAHAPLSLSREFVFDQRLPQQQTLTMAESSASQSVTLTMASEPVSWADRQVDRRKQDTFRQGSSANTTTESFQNLEKSPVDILFVVDNSSSMREEHERLSDKLSTVIGHIQSADWRLAVVSTDSNDHCGMRRVITKGSADPSGQFTAAIDALGLGGDSTEKGFFKAVEGLQSCSSDDVWGSGWLRDNSAVATVIVSDEDNCSDGWECRGQAHGKAKYLTNYLKSIRTLGATAKVYGLIKRSRRECRSAPNVGRQYLQAIKATSGIAGSICAPDYSEVLSQLSKDLSETLIHNLNLSHTPLGGDSTTVWVDGRELRPADYRIQGNAIVLDAPLQPGQLAKVRYTYRPEPLKTRFALSTRPARQSLKVAVNGTETSGYRIKNEGGVFYLTFFEAPAANAKIVARYNDRQRLKSTFVFAQPLKEARDLKVTLDGKETKAYTIDDNARRTKLIFEHAPTDGAVIALSFTRDIGRKLRYPVTAAGDELLGITDETSGEAVDAWLEDEGNTLVVPDAQFAVGRRLKLDFRSIEGVMFTLPEGTDATSLVIRRDGNAVCQDQVIMADGQMDLHGCHAAIGNGAIELSFDIVHSGEGYLFTWPDIGSHDEGELLGVTITINEQATTEYAVEGSGVRFLTPLSDQDRVYIRCDYQKLHDR